MEGSETFSKQDTADQGRCVYSGGDLNNNEKFSKEAGC